MEQPGANSQYTFSYNEGVPNSLTMMKKSCYLIKQIYDMPQILWIDGILQQSTGQKDYISEQIGNKITCYEQVTNEIIESVKKFKQVIIICSNKSAIKVNQSFFLSKEVISIICYCWTIQYYEQNKKKKLLGQKFKLGTTDQKKLIQQLIHELLKNKKLKELPTFISMANQVQKSNTKMKTLSVLLRQQTNKSKIHEQLKKLIEFTGLKTKIESLLQNNYNENQFLERCVKQFSESFQIQILINSLLRSTSHPTDNFIMQPFVCNIFNYIKKLYKNEPKNKSQQKFYRGGQISNKELNILKISVGKIIQNLGFFKTTQKRQDQESYISNVLFIIAVKNNDRNNFLDFGYTKIGKFIFFNHLNSFKISKIQYKSQKIKSYFQISLLYGELAKNTKDFTQDEKYFKSLAQLQSDIMRSNRYLIIGSVLTDGNRSFPGSQQYWKQYTVIAGNSNDKKIGLINLGKTLLNNKKYEESRKIFTQLLDIRQKNSLGYATTLSNLALTYQKLNMNNEAINCYNLCLQTKYSLYYDVKNIAFSATYNNLGKLYYQQKKYRQALEQFQLCKEIDKKNLGELHPNYALTLGNIAAVYYANEKYTQAFQNFTKAKEIQCRILGENHPEHICTMKNLAKVFEKTKKKTIAKQILQKIDEILNVTKQG